MMFATLFGLLLLSLLWQLAGQKVANCGVEKPFSPTCLSFYLLMRNSLVPVLIGQDWTHCCLVGGLVTTRLPLVTYPLSWATDREIFLELSKGSSSIYPCEKKQSALEVLCDVMSCLVTLARVTCWPANIDRWNSGRLVYRNSICDKPQAVLSASQHTFSACPFFVIKINCHTIQLDQHLKIYWIIFLPYILQSRT